MCIKAGVYPATAKDTFIPMMKNWPAMYRGGLDFNI